MHGYWKVTTKKRNLESEIWLAPTFGQAKAIVIKLSKMASYSPMYPNEFSLIGPDGKCFSTYRDGRMIVVGNLGCAA